MESQGGLCMNPTEASIQELQQGYQRKDWSCGDVVQAYLERIQTTDKTIGAYLRIRETAAQEAQAVDARLADGLPLRPLEGIPIAVKDNLLMQGEVTTAASKILAQYTAVYTATAVARLQAAGAIVLGKTNMDEFAMGTSTENSALGETKNPWNPAMVPGGSSGGSAAAVAADLAPVAIGSDTGGSIRQPAAFCGVVGMKPTYGRVSRYGLIALASSLDQIGPFSRRVDDAARVYQAMAGQDDCDMTSSREAVDDPLVAINQPLNNIRIGLPVEFFGQGLDPKVEKIVRAAAAEYEKLGARLVEVHVPHAADALATYYVLQPAEASSNLARFDGIRYGLSVRDGSSLEEIYRHTRAAGFGPETKRRIMLGTFSLSAGYADAYYHRANLVRSIITEELHQAFDQVDVLLTPTTPSTPFARGSKTQDPLTMYLADLYTVPANLAGIPAMSLPAGFIDGLPVGFQLMTRAWNESRLFQIGQAYQAVTDWHTQRPAA